MTTTTKTQRRNQLNRAVEAHAEHDDPSLHADCSFCVIALTDAEHRAYLGTTDDAYEHHHGR